MQKLHKKKQMFVTMLLIKTLILTSNIYKASIKKNNHNLPQPL